MTHGFLMQKAVFTSIDFPDANVTRAFGINARGWIVGDYSDAGWARHGFLATFIVGGPVRLWNPAADWKNAPYQANPSPDSYGNAGVWRYMASYGFEHNPNTYELLPAYDTASERWYDPSYINLLVEHSTPTSASLRMHSYGGRVVNWGRNSILAWTSPVNGRIHVNGSVRVRDPEECGGLGSGILWSICRDAESLLQTDIPAGGGTTFEFETNVREGQTLYFVRDAGLDSSCDAATVQLLITKP